MRITRCVSTPAAGSEPDGLPPPLTHCPLTNCHSLAGSTGCAAPPGCLLPTSMSITGAGRSLG
ncbi:MAG: hypothetical protein QM783_03890 [Phycisphaerales bacterium]